MKINKYIIFSLVIYSILIFELLYNELIDITLLIILIILIILLHYKIYRHFYKINKEFDFLNTTIEALLNGNIDNKINPIDYIYYRELNANIYRLIKKMEKMNYKKEEDEQTIKNLTNNITSPIVYIDRDGRIRYVNNQFVNKFQVSVEVNEIYEKLRIRNLYKFIDDAFIFETNEILTIQIGESFYQANAIPIYNNNKIFVGILFIFHDITEIKKYEKLQREYLADASHELKTPISAIKGASEILLNGDKHTEETVKEFLTIIKNENQRMERIVRDILLISRLENENILIHNEKVDIKKLLNETIEAMSFKLQNKNQVLYANIGDNLFIEGNYERLKHAFLNLISNAINYTNENKSIYVKAYKEHNNIVVIIKDEGIGIDKANLPHIFERFYRVDKARSRETGGTGLGLAIVKSTLDSHKAKIEVNSKINVGTEFLISFNKYEK